MTTTSRTIANNTALSLADIPVLSYEDFLRLNTGKLGRESCHVVQYFGFRYQDGLKLICCVADDSEGTIEVSSTEIANIESQLLPSMTAKHLSFHPFERSLHEKFGIRYADHPWLKPLRYPFDRINQSQAIADYPFYQISSEELHEVGVGPIHAGVIEPGHFRFICNGEQILHLEIQLGYQHRGVEHLMVTNNHLLKRTLLAESIAGDTVAGHTVAFVNLWETMCGYTPSTDARFARTVAIELERIAIHTGNLSAICTDIGYQLGSAVFGRLRTPIINFFQEWCGNRLAKGLIRPGYNPWYFSKDLADRLAELLEAYEKDLDQMWKVFHKLPGVLARLEKTGSVSKDVSASIGTVGMAARASGIARDVRVSHPHDLYKEVSPQTVVKHHGDVYSRTQLRYDEINQSIWYLRRLMRKLPSREEAKPLENPTRNVLALSLTEGWRGEICHCAITNGSGELIHYSIKDPSVHNWLALAMAVRNNEISDFPICNKSFDLSYCGHDL